jgi:hypothetical protein
VLLLEMMFTTPNEALSNYNSPDVNKIRCGIELTNELNTQAAMKKKEI